MFGSRAFDPKITVFMDIKTYDFVKCLREIFAKRVSEIR